MDRVRIGLRWVIGVFLVLHGAVHAMGFLGAWEIATFEGASRAPNVLLDDAGDVVVRLIGVGWLVAGLAVIVAGYGVLRHASWEIDAVFAGALISLPVTLLWIDDAIAGVVVNVATLLTVAIWFIWSVAHHQPVHHLHQHPHR